MRRSIVFLSRFMLGVWIVLVTASLFLLLSNAPDRSMPFSKISVEADTGSVVYLPAHIFDCTEIGPQLQCEATIHDRDLVLSGERWREYEGDPITFETCQAQYDSKPVSCEDAGYMPVMGLPSAYEVEGLALSAQQFSALEMKYKGTTLIKNLTESELTSIAGALALLGGIVTGCFVWLQPNSLSKLFASFICGFGMYRQSWFFLLHHLLYSPNMSDRTFDAFM